MSAMLKSGRSVRSKSSDTKVSFRPLADAQQGKKNPAEAGFLRHAGDELSIRVAVVVITARQWECCSLGIVAARGTGGVVDPLAGRRPTIGRVQ